MNPVTTRPQQPGAALDTAVLDVQQLSKSYRSRKGDVPAVRSIEFAVHAGQFVSVVGPSGCGKTTLMMCIAGLLPISGGAVMFRGERMSGPRDGVAVVFQDYSRSLFPWLTVEKNVALPLRDRGLPRAEIRQRVQESLEMVGLAHAAGLHPWQLSGGMQQRVAIARGLAVRPEMLIMDEPFASVDAQTRASLEDLLLKVWAETGTTVLFVTHDIDEAVYLSDRVVVLSQGPSVVVADLPVTLDRPRDQIATKQTPLFGELREHVYSLVMASQRRTSLSGEPS
ncbi:MULTISPECIES: ABC transporter ATP-binding protein [Micromonospora]|uniref:ABC transporter ATP-binding protein n=1 Tax=Micromonospora antibiotica TaxID=2807623 RepID=A0ABS3VET2_9ACTN|nr:ABC transporter ATP-binding protein [Micromonospora antibiotica]MBO4164125.1 ABC transporter ATP-binding protein [Micromonospora antibiotica]